MEATVLQFFERAYGSPAKLQRVFCPYRVCPIGAHSDHQYGKVTGFAIDKGIEILFEPTDDGIVQLISRNLPGEIVFSVEAVPRRQNDWGDYLRGAITALQRRTQDHRPMELIHGIRGVVNGMLPIGGLSSSAALTIAFMSAVCAVNGVTMTPDDVIRSALAAESEYVGVHVGTLDQSCEVLSKGGHMLYLDTRDGGYELIPAHPSMPPYEFAILFSGVERKLMGSRFNVRVDELKSAAYALKAFSGMEYGRFNDARLRDVPREVFEQYRSRLPENWEKRALHFYTEFLRAEQGAEAWRRGDLAAYGKLSFESGYSSIYNYQTGSDELKTLYEIMLDTPGVYGGRFSGAGYKGCCMALINPMKAGQIQETVTRRYCDAFPALKDKFSVAFCHSADGCRFGESTEVRG